MANQIDPNEAVVIRPPKQEEYMDPMKVQCSGRCGTVIVIDSPPPGVSSLKGITVFCETCFDTKAGHPLHLAGRILKKLEEMYGIGHVGGDGVGMLANEIGDYALEFSESLQHRIDRAVEAIGQFGSADGAHHKMWVIDQVLLILLGDNVAYTKFIEDRKKDGYDWDKGVWDKEVAP